MVLKNILLVVSDMERAKHFYRTLFGLEVTADFGENVILMQRLVLQERQSWEMATGREAKGGGNDTELYFEESDMDAFLQKLEDDEFAGSYLNHCVERDWGQRMVRICDPDGHVIEVGESSAAVKRRLEHQGLTPEQIATKMHLPPE
ncbi:MAG: VOC family protein [Blautia sp.]|jgi:catechol 2,3-dioxygenase-like lactoylglutathione lyase family enzyme